MPVKVINDSGTVLLDDTYQNLALASHTSFSTSFLGTSDPADFYAADMNSGCGYRLSVPDSVAGNPLLAIRSTSLVSVAESYRSGASTVFLIKSAQAASVDAYVFGLPSVISGNGDLQLFNAAGVKTFDSSMRYSRVVDFVQCYPPDSTTTPPPTSNNTGWSMPWATNRSYDSSRTYACAQVTSDRFWDQDGRGQSGSMYIAERTIGCRFSGATAFFDYGITRQGAAGGDTEYDATGGLEATFMVIDVTNY